MEYKITFYSSKELSENELIKIYSLLGELGVQNTYICNENEEPEQFI